jgi:hypothetical protein
VSLVLWRLPNHKERTPIILLLTLGCQGCRLPEAGYHAGLATRITLPLGDGWEIAGFGIPDYGNAADEMYSDRNELWVNTELEDARPFTQEDMEWAHVAILRDSEGAYHTFHLDGWEDSSLEDLLGYMDAWLESEYA